MLLINRMNHTAITGQSHTTQYGTFTVISGSPSVKKQLAEKVTAVAEGAMQAFAAMHGTSIN